MSKITVAQAMETLKKAMKDDPNYAWSWHCNLAVSFQDVRTPYDMSNAGAARFMKTAFDANVSDYSPENEVQ